MTTRSHVYIDGLYDLLLWLMGLVFGKVIGTPQSNGSFLPNDRLHKNSYTLISERILPGEKNPNPAQINESNLSINMFCYNYQEPRP